MENKALLREFQQEYLKENACPAFSQPIYLSSYQIINQACHFSDSKCRIYTLFC